MTDEEKEQIKENRRIHKLEQKKQIATDIKEKAISDVKYSRTSDKLRQAIKFYSQKLLISESVLKDTVRTFYPEFYRNYINDSFLNEEYFVRLANNIINNPKITKKEAKAKLGYNDMISYLESKNPELLEKVEEVLNESKRFSLFNLEVEGHDSKYSKLFNLSSLDALVEIMLEFRVRLSEYCTFVNEISNLFLNANQQITEDDLVKGLLSKRKNYDEAIRWYFMEVSSYTNPDKYTEEINYRINKFNEFRMNFTSLKNTPDKLNKYVLEATTIDLKTVYAKVHVQVSNSPYHFTNDEVRNIIKFVYKYGLNEKQIDQLLGIPRFSGAHFVANFQVENIEDQIIIDGYHNLIQYKKDMAGAYYGIKG